MNKIDKPGVYDLTMEEYHGQCCVGPSISSSGLRKIFSQSPAHYWDTSDMNPDAEEDEEKASFIIGRAAHHLLLGEDNFSTLFIGRPEKIDGAAWHGNRTACKEWLVTQAKAGRTVVTPAQIEQIRGMAKALSVHPLVNAGILNGEIEKSLVWQDEETGIWLKARPDAVPNDSGDFADLKGTSFYGDKLDRAVFEHRYDMQAGLTKWGAREVLDLDMESFSFVFCTFKRPHCVDVLTLDKADIEAAEHDLRMSLRTFAWCLKHNNWFGPSGTQQDARYVHISEWQRNRSDYQRSVLEREIAKAEAVDQQYSEADYLGA